LDEAALKFYDVAPEKTKFDYEAIKEYLIKELNSEDKDIETLMEFYSAKQEVNESVDEFAQRLLTLERECPLKDKPVIERNKSKIFIKNCNSEIQKMLISDDKLPFNKLWKKARAIEKCIEESKKFAVASTSKVDESPTEVSAAISTDKVKCYVCNKIGHFAKDCKDKPKYNNNSNKYSKIEKNCAFCGRRNHIIANCNELKNLKNENNAKNKNANQKYCSFCKMNSHNNRECRNLKDKCYICFKDNHMAKDCRKKKSN
jgi:hypothetical protein